MSVVFRKIYVDGGVSRDSGDGTRSLPSEMSFVASQIFPVPGRTRASEESGGRMAGRYVRLPGVKGGEPEARSEPCRRYQVCVGGWFLSASGTAGW